MINMATIKTTLDEDKERLMQMEPEKLIKLLLLHVRDIWTEDGLYFLGIEDKFGTEPATEIDAGVWAVMGRVQAQRIRRALDIKDTSLTGLFETLKNTDWWLDMEEKEYNLEEDRLTITNRKCRVHEARKNKGLDEFNCKQVRFGMLKNFAKAINLDIKVDCLFCPKGPHPKDAWCSWQFSIKK
jgi:hypothetical protein